MSQDSIVKIRADRIREEIPILRVLYDYGYGVRPEGENREQQFCCDLHGDGRDTKPSARIYPESNSFYCFACGSTRDSIALVRTKENLSFWDAIRTLEQRYGLPPLDIDATLTAQNYREQRAALPDLNAGKEYPQMRERLARRLELVTQEKSLPMEQVLTFWEALDQVVHKVSQSTWTEKQGHEIMTKLLEKIQAALTKRSS